MPKPTFSRFAGINNRLPAERLHSLPSRDDPTSDLAAAVNVDIDNSGQARRRTGQTLKVAGNVHSLWADGEVCLYITGGAMKRLNSDFSSNVLAMGLTDAPMTYLSVNQRVYHSNGTQTAVLDIGRVRSWGIDINQISVNGSASNGLMTAGTYQYAMTLVRDDGQESGTGMAARIDLPDQAGIVFRWTAPSDPSITEVALYITQPNGETLLQAAVVDARLGEYSYTGGERALALATQWLDRPPAAQSLTWHRGRIFLAVGEHLFATTALGYEWCDLRDFLAVDGTRIAFVMGVERGVFIGTEQSVFFLAGDKLDELAPRMVVPAAGLAGSAVMVDGYVATSSAALAGQHCAMFATAEGICLGLPDGSIQHLTQQRYRYAMAQTATACFRQTDTLNQYLLFTKA